MWTVYHQFWHSCFCESLGITVRCTYSATGTTILQNPFLEWDNHSVQSFIVPFESKVAIHCTRLLVKWTELHNAQYMKWYAEWTCRTMVIGQHLKPHDSSYYAIYRIGLSCVNDMVLCVDQLPSFRMSTPHFTLCIPHYAIRILPTAAALDLLLNSHEWKNFSRSGFCSPNSPKPAAQQILLAWIDTGLRHILSTISKHFKYL